LVDSRGCCLQRQQARSRQKMLKGESTLNPHLLTSSLYPKSSSNASAKSLRVPVLPKLSRFLRFFGCKTVVARRNRIFATTGTPRSDNVAGFRVQTIQTLGGQALGLCEGGRHQAAQARRGPRLFVIKFRRVLGKQGRGGEGLGRNRRESVLREECGL
jgi:hypothetical protein